MIGKISSAVFLCLLFAAASYSQTTQNAQKGKIFGVVVSHENGSIIQGVKVIVEGKDFRRKTITNADGRYEMEVPPGIYKITTEVQSFKKFKRKNLKIAYPGSFIQNISLKFGKTVQFNKKALKEMGF